MVVTRMLDGTVDKSSAEQHISSAEQQIHKSDTIHRSLKLAVDQHVAFFSQVTVLFQQIYCISNIFQGNTITKLLYKVCMTFVKPMILYPFLLFIAIAMNDT